VKSVLDGRVRGLFLAAASALLATTLVAEPRTYLIRSDGKNIAGFTLSDAIETVDGTTTKVTGTIVADPDDPAASSVEVSVGLSVLDTGIKLRDQHVRERYAETTKFPQATFKSVSVSGPSEPIAPNQPAEIRVTGDYEMHGVTRRITVPVRVVVIPETELSRSTRGPGDLIHATAKFALKLSDFGIRVPQSFVGNAVDVRLDVFAVAPVVVNR
jgi:polyisoprenoid-binding protein YceI